MTRTVLGKKLSQLRQQGLIPGVVYGHRVATRSVAAPQSEFVRVWKQAGASTLVDLILDGGAPIKVLIQEVQHHPVTRALLHVDFHQVNLEEKIMARIKLQFTGTPPAVKELGGILMTTLNEIQVSCLPQALVQEITVDLSRLKTFQDYLHVADLSLPAGIVALDKPATVVAHVIKPRSQEELKALDQQPAASAAAAAEVPVVGKEQKEHAVEPPPAPTSAKG